MKLWVKIVIASSVVTIACFAAYSLYKKKALSEITQEDKVDVANVYVVDNPDYDPNAVEVIEGDAPDSTNYSSQFSGDAASGFDDGSDTGVDVNQYNPDLSPSELVDSFY